MSNLYEYAAKARHLMSEGLDWELIQMRLTEMGADPDLAAEATKLVRKEIHAASRSKGMVLIGIGSAICAFSMFYTLLFGHNYFILYGLTIVGVTLAFAGLVFVMG